MNATVLNSENGSLNQTIAPLGFHLTDGSYTDSPCAPLPLPLPSSAPISTAHPASTPTQPYSPAPRKGLFWASFLPKTPAVPHVLDNRSNFFRVRSDDRLANLPLEDQLTLLRWLNAGIRYRDIIDRALLQRPAGLGFKISLGSLSRFWHKHAGSERLMETVALIDSNSAHSEDQVLIQTALALIAENYPPDLLSTPEADRRAIRQLVAFVTRPRNLVLQQRARGLRQLRRAFAQSSTLVES